MVLKGQLHSSASVDEPWKAHGRGAGQINLVCSVMHRRASHLQTYIIDMYGYIYVMLNWSCFLFLPVDLNTDDILTLTKLNISPPLHLQRAAALW